jgi:hypothetical protein
VQREEHRRARSSCDFGRHVVMPSP